MINQNGFRRLHVRPFAIVAVLTAAVCATTQSVYADPASPGTSSVRVNFSGIDLSTSGGQEKAKERLVQAARLTCQRVEETQCFDAVIEQFHAHAYRDSLSRSFLRSENFWLQNSAILRHALRKLNDRIT